MEKFPKDLMDFEWRFNSEEACEDYLVWLRWPEGFECPKCHGTKAWITNRKLRYCVVCGKETSPLAGTIFQDTRKPLRLWFRAMWYVVNQKNGVSALGLQKALGLSRYETAWTWLHKLRGAMVRPGRERLSGKVEADEIFIGGERQGKRGRGAEGKSLVLIMAEDKGKRAGRIRLRRVRDASAAALIPAVLESAEIGSEIRTDGWRSYNALTGKGYKRTIIRQSATVGENLLPLANRVASLLKRWLQGTHQGAVGHAHLDYYLDEFTFRFNRRESKSRGLLFYRLLQQAVAIPPTKAEHLRRTPGKSLDVGVT